MTFNGFQRRGKGFHVESKEKLWISRESKASHLALRLKLVTFQASTLHIEVESTLDVTANSYHVTSAVECLDTGDPRAFFDMAFTCKVYE